MEPLVGEKVVIRDKTLLDIIDSDIWLNDPEIIAINPPVGFSGIIMEFSIDTINGTHIGSCELYNIDLIKLEAQIGIMIGGKEYWGHGYGSEAIKLLSDYALGEGNIKRLWLKVLPINTRAIRCYEKCSYSRCGRLTLDGYDFILMERRG